MIYNTSDRGLHDHVLLQLGAGGMTAPSSTSAGSSISHVFQATRHPAPPLAGSIGSSVAASSMSTTFPSTSLEYLHGAVSAPAGIRRLELPLNVTANNAAPSAPLPSGGGSFMVPGVTAQLDRPAHVHTKAARVEGELGIPQSGSAWCVGACITINTNIYYILEAIIFS